MGFYAGFDLVCDGVAEFPTRKALDEWLKHDTEIDRFLNRDAVKQEGTKRWDASLGNRVEFSPTQVSRMFGGSDFSGQLYESREPSTGPDVMWHYL